MAWPRGVSDPDPGTAWSSLGFTGGLEADVEAEFATRDADGMLAIEEDFCVLYYCSKIVFSLACSLACESFARRRNGEKSVGVGEGGGRGLDFALDS